MRDMTPEAAAKSQGPSVDMILFMEGQFPSETLRFWSGKGDLPWDGKVWKGTGDLVRISEVEETAEEKAIGYVVTLAGVMPNSVALALREDTRNSLVTVWLAFLEYAPGEMNIVDVPLVLFKGFSSTLHISTDNQQAELALQVEHPLRNLRRPNRHLWTDERQKKDWPSDRGFEQVATLPHQGGLTWGG